MYIYMYLYIYKSISISISKSISISISISTSICAYVSLLSLSLEGNCLWGVEEWVSVAVSYIEPWSKFLVLPVIYELLLYSPI